MDELLRNLAPVVGVVSIGLVGLVYARWLSRQAAKARELPVGSGQPAE